MLMQGEALDLSCTICFLGVGCLTTSIRFSGHEVVFSQ